MKKHVFKKLLSISLSGFLLLSTSMVPGMGIKQVEAAEGDIEICSEYFPDEEFRKYLRENLDTDKDGYLSEDERNTYFATQMQIAGRSIKNLQGIEYFTNLTYLDCSNCELSELDVRMMENLTGLHCSGNNEGFVLYPNTGLLNLRSDMETASYVDPETVQITIIKKVPVEYYPTKMIVDFSGVEDYDTKIVDGLIYYTWDEDYEQSCIQLDGSAIELPLKANSGYENWYYSFQCRYRYSDTVQVFMCFELVEREVSSELPDDKYGDVPIDEEHFPDLGFRRYISSNVDLDKDGILSSEEAKAVRRLLLRRYIESGDTIKNLKGIEYLYAITILDCWGKGIEELDVSANTELEVIDCSNNNLKALNLGKNEKLEQVICSNNPLETLTFENNPNLKSVSCEDTDLTTLDVSKATNLESLACDHSTVSELKVNKNLKKLSCSNMTNFQFHVEDYPNLESLNCSGNHLTNLDLSNNLKLQELICSGNELESLNTVNNPDLRSINCANNLLTELDVSKNPELETLKCNFNQLKILDVSVCESLVRLECHDNQLTRLDVSSLSNLCNLYCQENNLSELKLKDSAKFYGLLVDYENLEEALVSDAGSCIWVYMDVPVTRSGAYLYMDISNLSDWDTKISDNTINYSWGTGDSKQGDVYRLNGDSKIKLPGTTVEGSVHCSYQVGEHGMSVYFDFDNSVGPDVETSYRTHVQYKGWSTYTTDGKTSGTMGYGYRLEAIEIKLNTEKNLGIQYTTHCQTYGWLPWSRDGEMNGTEGESKRLEAIKIQLTGSDTDQYDVYYRVHAQTYGWLGWAKNGEMAGTAGLSKRLEAIQIVVVGKGEEAPSDNWGNIQSTRKEASVTGNGASSNPTVKGEDTANVAVRTHVQTYGWQGWKYNGVLSGTSGESKRLEGINIKLTNQLYDGGIEYRTHVQNYGWMDWKKNGEMSGTSGESKRLEAIQIRLTGKMAEKYDVYYRVHSQKFGWLGWAKNGEMAGTAGYSYRLESIQVVLVPKGDKAPATSFEGVTGSASVEAYKQK